MLDPSSHEAWLSVCDSQLLCEQPVKMCEQLGKLWIVNYELWTTVKSQLLCQQPVKLCELAAPCYKADLAQIPFDLWKYLNIKNLKQKVRW